MMGEVAELLRFPEFPQRGGTPAPFCCPRVDNAAIRRPQFDKKCMDCLVMPIPRLLLVH